MFKYSGINCYDHVGDKKFVSVAELMKWYAGQIYNEEDRAIFAGLANKHFAEHYIKFWILERGPAELYSLDSACVLDPGEPVEQITFMLEEA